MSVVQNKKGTTAVILSTGNETITLANLQVAGETVDAAHITKLKWSTTGTITITRGALVLTLTGTHDWDLDESAWKIDDAVKTSSMVIVVPAASTLITEVRKTSTFYSDYLGPVV